MVSTNNSLNYRTVQHSVIVGDVNNGISNVAPGTATNVLTSNGTDWISSAPLTGGFNSIVTQVFTTSGVYTPSVGMKYCIAEAVGGGGGGAGTFDATPGLLVSVGGCGSAGGYCRKTISAIDIGSSQVVTVGDAGGAGPANSVISGAQPTASSLGSIIIANPGISVGGVAASSFAVATNGVSGGTATGGDVNCSGGNSSVSFSFIFYNTSETADIGMAVSGNGGSSFYGPGAKGRFASGGILGGGHGPGIDAVSYGSGGSGAVGAGGGATGDIGGAGAPGIVIITEYI